MELHSGNSFIFCFIVNNPNNKGVRKHNNNAIIKQDFNKSFYNFFFHESFPCDFVSTFLNYCTFLFLIKNISIIEKLNKLYKSMFS